MFTSSHVVIVHNALLLTVLYAYCQNGRFSSATVQPLFFALSTILFMTIYTNGTSIELLPGTTLGDVVQRLSLDPRTIIAELNEEALQRNEWQTRVLQENDRIEFLRIAAGG